MPHDEEAEQRNLHEAELRRRPRARRAVRLPRGAPRERAKEPREQRRRCHVVVHRDPHAELARRLTAAEQERLEETRGSPRERDQIVSRRRAVSSSAFARRRDGKHLIEGASNEWK